MINYTALIVSVLLLAFRLPVPEPKTPAVDKPAVPKLKLFSLPSKSVISYEGRHPLHHWKSVCNTVNCVITYNPDRQAIEAAAASARLIMFNSRNANRDSHALEVLDALAYPKVSFTTASVISVEQPAPIRGYLNLHGVTRAVEVTPQISWVGNRMTIEGAFPVHLTDFNVPIPSLLGIRIDDEIIIRFTFVFDA